jgi:AraC-like DNA-binding protein
MVLATAAVAAAGLAGGGAYAATQGSSKPSRQAFLNDVAHRLGIPESKLAAALKAAQLDRLHQAVKDGRLTQAQADVIAKRIQQRPPGWLGAPLFGPRAVGPRGVGPRGLAPRAFGPGPGGPGAPGLQVPRPPGALGLHGPFATAASYLGLTRAQLITKLKSGQTLAQIARSKHKSVSGLEQAMTAAAKSRLDRAVRNGRISSAEEKQILGALSTRIQDVVNGHIPRRLEHPGFRPGAFEGPGPQGRTA